MCETPSLQQNTPLFLQDDGKRSIKFEEYNKKDDDLKKKDKSLNQADSDEMFLQEIGRKNKIN